MCSAENADERKIFVHVLVAIASTYSFEDAPVDSCATKSWGDLEAEFSLVRPVSSKRFLTCVCPASFPSGPKAMSFERSMTTTQLLMSMSREWQKLEATYSMFVVEAAAGISTGIVLDRRTAYLIMSSRVSTSVLIILPKYFAISSLNSVW